ncbi:hypothetical protein ACFYUY_34705 [Kitasatospora sp. NPDC004745]|uniref:hypothetical protein n=1 Tax=Kitasatospora sp. NPDC004745 TaxID=3364019 RepID=UPI0036C58B03
MTDFSDSPDDEYDPLTLSPAVEEFLGDPGTPADVFSALVAFLVDLRENPFPHLSMPVPGRPGCTRRRCAGIWGWWSTR